MTVVYADVLFIINTAADYLMLLATSAVCDVHTPRLRLAASAVLGGAYSVLCLLPGTDVLTTWAFRLAAAAVMLLTAFWGQKRLTRLAVVFFGASAMFGGATYAFALTEASSGRSPLLRLAVVFAVCWAAVSAAFKRGGRSDAVCVALEVDLGGRTASMTALIDTGSTLSDPMTGRPAVVAESDALRTLFTDEERRALSHLEDRPPPDVLEELSDTPRGTRFQLLPYTSVGVSGGLLLAFRPDAVRVDGRDAGRMSVAISPSCVSDGGAYSALVGAGAWNMISRGAAERRCI